MFLIAAGLFIVGATTFLFLAQGEVQPWAKVNAEFVTMDVEDKAELVEKITPTNILSPRFGAKRGESCIVKDGNDVCMSG